MFNGKPMGYIFSLLSAFLWATLYVMARAMLGGEKAGVDPVTLSAIRFLCGGALLFTISFFSVRESLFSFSKRDFLKIAILSQFSLVMMSVFLFFGQRYTSAINSSMIMSSSPVLTMIFGLLIGERVKVLQWVGMAIATFGCMMVIGVISQSGFAYSPKSITGDLLVLIASASWALGAVLAKKIVTPGNDLAITSYSMLIAGASALLINCFRINEIILHTDVNTILFVAYVAIFPTALGFYAWNAALSRISLGQVNVMQYLTPIMTATMAVMFLGERIGAIELFGIILVIGGVILTKMGISPQKEIDTDS